MSRIRIRNPAIRKTLNFPFSSSAEFVQNKLPAMDMSKGCPHIDKSLRGRPPMRWMDNIKTICNPIRNTVGLDSVTEAGRLAKDSTVWKLLVARQLSPEPSWMFWEDSLYNPYPYEWKGLAVTPNETNTRVKYLRYTVRVWTKTDSNILES